MSYIAVEPATEQMLKTAFASALTAASLSATVRGWWLDDATSDDSEEMQFPQVNIKAGVNVPDGWRQPIRLVPVTVDLITFAADDQKRSTIKAMYAAIRNVLDYSDLTSDSFADVPAIVIDNGGDVYGDDLDDLLHIIRVELTVHACLGPQDY